ncbi:MULTISPECIES: MerR family transcriptional regulator [unclassified Aminobacter]|uniref:MerR family transcriptional regulator n=1 Tax=unclassified Aminobacter TaxID=2644704 RepID=UPI000467E704|nr:MULTISPECIES: MerR family transcriptional regulator [unclassified Aminobacter]TWG67661.1 MerR-like DNA binding protein [Aminobacter sp. J44]TWH28254.1 MerR-like DNA binding protein [Aminobacter sp. J15]
MDDTVTVGLKIDDLERRTGQPRRNIRFLIAEGVVPEPYGRGKAAYYTEEHVTALTMYSDLKKAHSLEFIRNKVREALEGEVLELAPVEGVTVRVERLALNKLGIEALIETIGTAVKEAVEAKGKGKDRK